MEFLKKPIPSKHINKTIIINNQKFNVITKLSDILAGQYPHIYIHRTLRKNIIV